MSLKINEKPKPQEPKYSYPLAKISVNGMIVVFFDLTSGIVMEKGIGLHKVGHSSKDWTPHPDSSWKDVSITIESP